MSESQIQNMIHESIESLVSISAFEHRRDTKPPSWHCN
jgi:hypothetical protein